MIVPFTKMHGAGNDFIVIDATKTDYPLSTEIIQRLADRHFGIGFDQLLLIQSSQREDIDFKYRIYNADGSQVSQCGNGARCFARFVHEKNLFQGTEIRVETCARDLTMRLDHASDWVEVDMGEPLFEPHQVPIDRSTSETLYTLDIGENDVHFFVLNIGNPHIVIQVTDVDGAPVEELGHILSTHEIFPKGANVGFMQVINRQEISLRVFERGSGETLACGSGACAATTAGIKLGLLDSPVQCHMRGGKLSVTWSEKGENIKLSGPAETVYEGSFKINP